MKYFHEQIEAKWQEYWAKNQTFAAQNNSEKPATPGRRSAPPFAAAFRLQKRVPGLHKRSALRKITIQSLNILFLARALSR